MATKVRTSLPKTLEKRVFQEAGSKCAFCPEAEVVSLQIHHIDGDPSNNAFENLILVCATCHAKITGGVISEEAVRQKKRQLEVHTSKRNDHGDFRGFLARWKAKITAPSRGPEVVRCVVDGAITAYDDGLPDFHDWVERVREDFKGCQTFERLTSKLGSLKREDWQKRQPRDVITEAIDELIKFLA